MKAMIALMMILANLGTMRCVNVNYYSANTVVDSTGELWGVLDDVHEGSKGILWIVDSNTPDDPTDDIIIYSAWAE